MIAEGDVNMKIILQMSSREKQTAIKGLQMSAVAAWTEFCKSPESTLRNCFPFEIKNELVKTVHTSSVVFINMAFAMSLELLVLFTANNVWFAQCRSLSGHLTQCSPHFSAEFHLQALGELLAVESKAIKVTNTRKYASEAGKFQTFPRRHSEA